jgi:hypothetical protein
VDQVLEGEAQAAVALGVRYDEAQVGLHESVQRLAIPLLDAAAQDLLLFEGERLEVGDLPDVGVEAVAGSRALALGPRLGARLRRFRRLSRGFPGRHR